MQKANSMTRSQSDLSNPNSTESTVFNVYSVVQRLALLKMLADAKLHALEV